MRQIIVFLLVLGFLVGCGAGTSGGHPSQRGVNDAGGGKTDEVTRWDQMNWDENHWE